MIWTLYDPHVERDVDGPRSSVHDNTQLRPRRRCAPRTAETVLFLLEDANAIANDNPAPILH